MGCGACLQSKQVNQPIHIQTVSTRLAYLINKYQDYISQQPNHKQQISKNIHPVLTLAQCKIITDFIASGNGQLPQSRYKNQQKSTKNSNINQAGGAQNKILLTQAQRIIWKCLLIIPSHIQQHNNQLPNIKIPPYKPQIKDSQQIVQNSFYQISLDVNRTFPTLKYLDRGHLTLLLRNIVNCLPGIGYTQGMNFYAGYFLLCGFTIQQAYYILITIFISPNFFISHNFNQNFSQVMACNNILSNSIPISLHNHLQDLGISQQIYSFSWFLCCYFYTFDIQICAIIWDWIIKSGSVDTPGGGFVGIVNIGICIMEKLRGSLEQVNTADSLMNVFRDNTKQVFNQQSIIQIIDIIKARSLEFQKNPLKYSKKIQNQNKFRKLFITKKDLLQQDPQLKKTLKTKQGYLSYINQIFGWSRKKDNKNNMLQNEQIVIVGKPNLIKITNKQN